MLATRNIDAPVILPVELEPMTSPSERGKAAGRFVTVVDRELSQSGIGAIRQARRQARCGSSAVPA